MLSAFARGLLLSPRLAHRLAATSGTPRHFVSPPTAVRSLQVAQAELEHPQKVMTPIDTQRTLPCCRSAGAGSHFSVLVQVPSVLPEASEPFGFRVRYDEVPAKNVRTLTVHVH